MSSVKTFFKGAWAYIKRRGLALGAAVLVAASAITLGALWVADSATSAMYTVWLYSAQDTSYYKDYSENPVLQYMLSTDEYSDISFSFTVPASDAQNSYDLMIASKSFPTLMDSSVADPAGIMYENGYILDITDYVKEYMPNYYSMLDPESENFNEALYSKVVYEIDGEEKILSINSVCESNPYANWGYAYRRDWIVKYGTNPSTGEAFTSNNDTENWEDNVKFPSYYGLSYTMDDDTHTLAYNAETAAFMQEYAAAYDYDGSEPVTISDWEWMFEIFTTAMADLGISYNGKDNTNGGYCISMYYTGYTALDGGLRSGFGGSGMVWYQDSDGEVSFGGTEDSTRAYLKCLNSWYENGWLDAYYNDRSTDSHYQVDKSSVTAGKVGMFLWDESVLDGNYDMGTSTYADGMMVMGCAYPVNDVYDYGTGEALYQIPAYLANTSTIGTGFYVMAGADSVDLEPLFTFLDEFYSEEGALMHTLGLSEDQVSSNLSETATTFYNSYDLSDGAYTKVVDSDTGKTTYKVNSTLVNGSSGLSTAACLNKLPGYEYVSSLDYGYTETHQNALNLWVRYTNTALIWGSDAMNKMSATDKSLCEDINSSVDTYMKKNAVNFIKGSSDIDNARAWSAWVSGVNKAAGGEDQIQAVTDIFTYYLALYPLV